MIQCGLLSNLPWLQCRTFHGKESSNMARNVSEIPIRRKTKMEVRIPFCNDIGTTESEREVRFPFSDIVTGNCKLKNESLQFRFPIVKGNEKQT